ncbi:hypothetical protein HDK64DRAFT_333711 [Phyllosticta capitalensis]
MSDSAHDLDSEHASENTMMKDLCHRIEGQRGVFMGFGSFPFHSVFQALPPYPGSITSSSSCASDTSTTSSFACSGTLTSSCIIPMSTVTAIHKNMTTAYWTLYQSGQSAAMLISTQSAAETKRQAGHLNAIKAYIALFLQEAKLNNPDQRGRLMLHVELSYEEGRTSVQQRRWYRLKQGNEEPRKIIDVNMITDLPIPRILAYDYTHENGIRHPYSIISYKEHSSTPY